MGFFACDDPVTSQEVAPDVTEGRAYANGTPHFATIDPFYEGSQPRNPNFVSGLFYPLGMIRCSSSRVSWFSSASGFVGHPV